MYIRVLTLTTQEKVCSDRTARIIEIESEDQSGEERKQCSRCLYVYNVIDEEFKRRRIMR